MLRGLKKLCERGDTIVEVMVVLAVLGLAIGISYATANRSLLATRGAQENSQASALLQGQVEQLRAWASDTDPTSANYIYRPAQFCMYNNSVTLLPNAQCTQQSLYDIAISYALSGSTARTFTLTATWHDVQGQGQDSATLVYRLYP